MLTPESATRKDRNSALGELQHRHFATIAEIIRRMPTHRADVAEHFADELWATNPKFDRARFLRACLDQ